MVFAHENMLRVSDWPAGFATAATGKFSWEVPSSLQVALAQGPGLYQWERDRTSDPIHLLSNLFML